MTPPTTQTWGKKCVNCGATWGQIFNNPHQCSGGELPRKRHVFPDLTATPPETGKGGSVSKNCTLCGKRKPIEQFAKLRKDSNYRQSSCGSCRDKRYRANKKRKIERMLASALAQGEKIGAEKERERIRKAIRETEMLEITEGAWCRR